MNTVPSPAAACAPQADPLFGPLLACLAALVLALLPAVASAQSLPALHDVAGVAPDDVLNVRAAPQAGAEKIGELAHDATDVEVVRQNDAGTWGLVSLGERSGWASMRYLAPQPSGDYVLSRLLHCVGTEPFWSLRVTQGNSATLATPDGPDIAFTAGLVQSAAGRYGRYSLRGGGPGGSFTAVIRAGACSDGMSDAAFGLDADVLVDGAGDVVHYTGCCSLVSN